MAWLASMDVTAGLFLIAVNLLVLVVGCIMDPPSASLLLAPGIPRRAAVDVRLEQVPRNQGQMVAHRGADSGRGFQKGCDMSPHLLSSN